MNANPSYSHFSALNVEGIKRETNEKSARIGGHVRETCQTTVPVPWERVNRFTASKLERAGSG